MSLYKTGKIRDLIVKQNLNGVKFMAVFCIDEINFTAYFDEPFGIQNGDVVQVRYVSKTR